MTHSSIWRTPLLFVALISLVSCTSLQATSASSEPALLQDIAYGDDDDKNKIDIYLPASANNAPIMFMVHGGAWRFGDKKSKAVVSNKVQRWVSKGFIFISANYRMLPKTDPLEQANDVARALAFAQTKAPDWGGDSSNLF